jgi:hypothetical protein
MQLPPGLEYQAGPGAFRALGITMRRILIILEAATIGIVALMAL